MTTSHLDPTDILHLFKYALAACRNHRYPVADLEYVSCINYAIARAIKNLDQHNARRLEEGLEPHSLQTYCVKVALHSCRSLRAKETNHRNHYKNHCDQDLSITRSSDHNQCDCLLCTLADSRSTEQAVDHLSDDEYQILLFVHTHGRAKAAKELELTKLQLADLLDSITHNYHQRSKNQ